MSSGELKLAFLCAAGALGGPWLFFNAFARLRLRRAVEDTPTSKARSAAMGKCELKGLAREIDLPILGPFSGRPCVWYHWKVEEERSDSKGNKSWHTLDERHSLEPFYIEDATGRLKVDPDGAEVEAPQLLLYSSGAFSGAVPPGPQAAPWLANGILGSRRRLSEWRIDQARPVYALGVLRPVKPGPEAEPEPVLTRGRDKEPFFISTLSEQELLSELGWKVWGSMVLGALIGTAGAAGLIRILVSH